MPSVTKISPKTLTLITTYRCTSACPNCCFNCSPKPIRDHIMTLSEMKNYIDRSIQAFPSIQMVIFTGGECTLLGQNLLDAIQYARKLNLYTRIVTNGHWAKNQSETQNIVNKFVQAGLNEINFSAGDEHSKFVEINRLSMAIAIAAKQTTFRGVVVNIEQTPHSTITSDVLKQSEQIQSLKECEQKRILFINSPWIEFRKHSNSKNTSEESEKVVVNNKTGCDSILDSLNINPYGQVLSCCGLCSEYSPILKLGSADNHSISDLSNKRFDDLAKLWIYTDGPYNILCNIGSTPVDTNCHQCEYCFQLLNNRDNIQKLLSIPKETIENIILNYNIKLSRYEKK